MSAVTEVTLLISRTFELSLLAKATAVLALGLLAVRLSRRRQASVRHFMLMATFAALVLLPLLLIAPFRIPFRVARPIPSVAAVRAPQATDARGSADLGALEPQSVRQDHRTWQLALQIADLIWILGSMLFLVPLVVSAWRVRRLCRTAIPWLDGRALLSDMAGEIGVDARVELLLHEDVAAPLTCGVRRPTIVLPLNVADWCAADLRRSIAHELEHIRRCDWMVQTLGRIVCGFYWFHPPVWTAWRMLCLEAERACDDAVIRNRARAEREDYAAQLVSLARGISKVQAQPVLGMANRSDLSRRVSALLDATQPRGRAGLIAVAAILLGTALVVLGIAPLQVVAQSSASHHFRIERRTDGSSPLARALYEAAETGDIPSMKRLANSGAELNAALPGDGSPLIGAARNGQLAAVRWLLDHGADPNMPVRGDGNPLIMAAREGHLDVVTLLLDRGADVNRAVPGDENALIQASGNGHLDAVKLLISRGADVNARIWVEGPRSENGEWRSPLSLARKNGRSDVVAYLLSVGAHE